MTDRPSLFVGIFISSAFVFASTGQASAGYFPRRPADARLATFSGVLNDYGIGIEFGEFTLIAGSNAMHFYIGKSMRINGRLVTCKDPELMGVNAGLMGCTDWPSWLVLGTTYVTATCWRDTTRSNPYVGETDAWFCDEIDQGMKPGHQTPGVFKQVAPTPP